LARLLNAEALPANTCVEVAGRWVPGDSGDPGSRSSRPTASSASPNPATPTS